VLPGPLSRALLPALVATTALGSALVSLTPTPAGAAAAVDPRPSQIGGSWLGDQLDGASDRQDYYLFGLGGSIDAALALDALGGHEDRVQQVADELDAQGDLFFTYASGRYHVYAGKVARVVRVAQVADRDPRAFAGRDVVGLLESRVVSAGAARGRIADDHTARDSDQADLAGQAAAAQALAVAGSGRAEDAAAYLLTQQCAPGWFAEALPAAEDPAQSCTGTTRTPDAGATALAALALGDLDGPAAAAARDRALDWLESAQAADGSFSGLGSYDEIYAAPGSDATTGATGLAGWALAEDGRTDAAQRAAAWIRARQADDPAACGSALTDQAGAVAPDAATLAEARSEGLETADDRRLGRFVRATAYALPALAAAPDTPAAPVPAGTEDAFRRAGTREAVAAGFAPGRQVCVDGPAAPVLVAATGSPTAAVSIALPGRTGAASYDVSTTSETVGTSTYRVLAATRLGVAYEKRPAVGRGQRVVVSGLEPGESVTVVARGARRARGVADDAGRFRASFTVGQRGRAGLSVRGEFPDRRAARTFVVVPRR